MIGQEAPKSFAHLKHLLRHHGAVPETVAVVAEELGPLCDKCLKAIDKTLGAG